MVKFKKLLVEKATENNSKYTYIDYKKLKGIINETYIKLRITRGKIININPIKTIFSSFLSFFTIKRLNEGEFSSKISDLKDFTKNPLIKDFFIELNKEINSLYKFYSREEISISNELNQLYINKNFDTENLTTLDDDSQKLYLLALKIKLLYECLILNFEAIRKICKKFDKKLKTFLNNNSFCIYYIKALNDYHNSDLYYLLKMQIIEQGLILIQNKIGYIKHRRNIVLNDPKKKNIITNVKDIGELTEEDLKNEINEHLEKSNDIIEQMITNEKYTITNINLGLILKYDDETQNINDDNNYKEGERLSFNDEYAIDYDNEHISILLKKEESLSITRMFINKDVYQNIINIFFYFLNDLNYRNIVLIFFHLFFNYLLLGVSYIQIIFVLLFTEEKQIKYYGLFIGLIFFSQFISNKILSNQKLSSIKFKIWIIISTTIAILLQLSYLYLINNIEEKEWNSYSFWIWSISFSILSGVCMATKLSNKYLISCVPKNTLLLMSKNLILFRGIFLYCGILLFYLLNKYFCFITIFLFLLLAFLFLFFYTEKDSEVFYKYKTNFNELSEKIKFFNNSGEIIERSQDINFNNDDIFNDDDGVRESVVLEDLREEQRIQLERANKEFNEINKRSNFTISNIVPEKTKWVIKNLSDGTKKTRIMFLFFFQFLSVFYKQTVFLITFINYIKNAKINNDINNSHIQKPYLFKITIYDVFVIISLPLGYLLYKAFNRYNDIHSVFRFYFIINCVLLFIFTFEYQSNYLLLFFVIYTTFNYVMDSKINIFFAVNYRNDQTYFKIKVNKLVNLAYYFGKIIGSICFYFFINNQFYFLSFGVLIYFGASFYDRFIKLSKIIILGRSYSKEIN